MPATSPYWWSPAPLTSSYWPNLHHLTLRYYLPPPDCCSVAFTGISYHQKSNLSIYYFYYHNNYHQVTIFNRPLFQNVLLASNVDIFFYLHRRVFIWSLCLGLLYLSTVGWYHYQQSRRKGAMVVPQLNDPERNCKQLHFPIIPWGDHIFLPPSSHKQNWQWKN